MREFMFIVFTFFLFIQEIKLNLKIDLLQLVFYKYFFKGGEKGFMDFKVRNTIKN